MYQVHYTDPSAKFLLKHRKHRYDHTKYLRQYCWTSLRSRKIFATILHGIARSRNILPHPQHFYWKHRCDRAQNSTKSMLPFALPLSKRNEINSIKMNRSTVILLISISLSIIPPPTPAYISYCLYTSNCYNDRITLAIATCTT